MSISVQECPRWKTQALAGGNVRSSESVTPGHPDMLMDVMADKILDTAYACLDEQLEVWRQTGDPKSEYINRGNVRVAIDGLVKGNEEGGTLSLAGEITLPDGIVPDYEGVVRETIKTIGYDDPNAGFWYGLPDLNFHITKQSENIAAGVNDGGGKIKGAGDQGICFGYATNEHLSLMPLPLQCAHEITAGLTAARKKFPWLKPDGKSQVGVNYINGKPTDITHVTLAAAHDARHRLIDVRYDLYNEVIIPVLDQFGFKLPISERELLSATGPIIINGAGPWCDKWGPLADSGEVGRKIDVVTYGGAAPHGGGALSGKDPSKVDRSGKYAARYIAARLVDEGFADRFQLGLSFSIGQPEPDSIYIETFGTEHRTWNETVHRISEILDLSVAGIIDGLNLLHISYAPTALRHFGNPEFPWEKFGNRS